MKRLKALMGGWLPQIMCGPDLWLTALAAGLIAVLGDAWGLRNAAIPVGTAQGQIGIAIIGVVLAGFGMSATFLDDEYLEFLEMVDLGVDADIWPYLWTTLIAGFTAVSGICLALVGPAENLLALRSASFMAVWSFFYLVWNMWHLAVFTIGHWQIALTFKQNRRKKRMASASHDTDH